MNSTHLRKWCILGFVLFANLFLFQALGTLGVSVFLFGLLAFVLSLTWQRERFQKLLPTATIFTLSILFFIFSLTLRAQGFVNFVLFASSFVFGALLFYLLESEQSYVRSFLELFEVPFRIVFGYFGAATRTHLTIPKAQSKKYPWLPKVQRILIGLLIGIPVVFVLINLFSSADPIYASYIKKVFNLKINWDLLHRPLTHIIVSGFLLAFLAPLIAFRLKKPAPILTQYLYLRTKGFVQEMTVVMGLVAVTLGSFLLVQWRYIFVSVPQETQLVEFGVKTYSEYVQRGFFELIFISLVLYGLTWLGLIAFRGREGKRGLALKTTQVVVLAEFGIFLLSVFRRIYLYQLHHGWSLVRLYGGFFLIGVGFFATTLLLRHFYEKRWVLVEGAGVLLLLLFFSLFNAEQFIATTHPPTVNNHIDYVYLSRMSADGVVGWQMAYDFAKNTLSQNFEGIIGKNERRDIFYANLVIQELLTKHDRLAYQYAAESEWLTYKKAVLTDLSHQHQALTDQLAASVSAQIATYGVNDEQTYEQKQLDAANQVQMKLDDALVNIPTDRVDANKKYASFGINHGFYSYFNTTPCTLYDALKTFDPDANFVYPQRCEYSVYHIYSWETKLEHPYGLSQLFLTNFSEMRAYAYLKQHISHEDLLLLMHKYFALRDRILLQPDNERDVEVDISFNTPLL